MLGELLDNAVSVFAPAAAARRAYARQVFRKQSQRAYEAARVDRMNSSWYTANQSADRALLGDADKVRMRSRDLIRNNAYARGAIDAIVANVVGCGIIPRPALENDDQNEAILRAWQRWCEQADSAGRLHFYEMQSLALREMIEAGEGLVHFTADTEDPIRVSPLALELIEADRIDSGQDTYRTGQKENTNEVRRGVELDRRGRAVGYYLFPTHPDGTGLSYSSSQRVDAAGILHVFRQERIGQTRGISWLSPAVMWLRDLGLYVDNEIQASAVASCFSVVIKTIDSGDTFGAIATPSGAESTDSDGNRFERIQPGLVSHLMPGESIETVNPSRPNSAAGPWIDLILRSIAVGMGLSYELVSRDYSKTNYSSNRASALEDRRRFKPLQKFLVWHLCQPVYREWFTSCVIAGRDGFPSVDEFVANPDAWLMVNWRPPGWEWVDPLKEAQASQLEVEQGFRSRGDVIESAGGDLREVYAELAQEKELAEFYGLTFGPQQAAAIPQSMGTEDVVQEPTNEEAVASV